MALLFKNKKKENIKKKVFEKFEKINVNFKDGSAIF
jgi:hypothetical protein